MRIHSGKFEIFDKDLEHATQVALHVKEDVLDNGHVLYMDNFDNPVKLTNIHTERRTYVCGTLRNKTKGNPKVVTGMKL